VRVQCAKKRNIYIEIVTFSNFMDKIPEVWDDCKTKEQKDQFIKRLEKIERNGKYVSFEEVIFKELMRRE